MSSSGSSQDASEDCRTLAAFCRDGASVDTIAEYYDAIMVKCARNPLYRSSFEREMWKLIGEEAVARALFSVLVHSYLESRCQNWNPSSTVAGHPLAHAQSHGTAGRLLARDSRIAASSRIDSTMLDIEAALNVELAGGSQPTPPEFQSIDDPVLAHSQTCSDHHVEDSSTEYRGTLVHRILFGNEANTGVAVRNVIELSGASSDGVVPPLVWIGFLASLFAPLVRRKWPRFAKDLSLIGHISTAWWHLVLLSTKYHSEQYALVNTTLTALFCIVIALALIRAGR